LAPLEERIEWLVRLCNLPARAKDALRILAEREQWTPLGKLVDRLHAPAFEVAQLASSRSPLREWGLVRLTLEPEPSLRLTERTWRFLHTDVTVRISDLPLSVS
jgi:hypothetical protein